MKKYLLLADILFDYSFGAKIVPGIFLGLVQSKNKDMAEAKALILLAEWCKENGERCALSGESTVEVIEVK